MENYEVKSLFEMNRETIVDEIMRAIGDRQEVPFTDTEIRITGEDGIHFRFDYEIVICYKYENEDPDSDIILKKLLLKRMSVIDKIKHETGYEDFEEDLLKRI